MKWVLSFLTAILFTNFNGKAQIADYIPIPMDATWEYRCSFWVDLSPQQQSYTAFKSYYFHLGGDTLINDTAYVLLQEQEEGSNEVQISSAIRQDTIARKVYARSLETEEEFLLYDFSITASDTIHCGQAQPTFSIYPYNDDGAYWATLHGDDWDVLDSTSNTLTGHGYSNSSIYYFSNYSWGGKAVWVEGIGSLVFLTSPCAYDGEFASCNLIRFCTGDTAWSPWGNACDITLDIQSNSNPNCTDLNAYWDGNSIQIKGDFEIEQVELINILGSEVEFGQLLKVGPHHWKIEMPRINSSGTYVLRYSQSGFIGNHKMFISQF